MISVQPPAGDDELLSGEGARVRSSWRRDRTGCVGHGADVEERNSGGGDSVSENVESLDSKREQTDAGERPSPSERLRDVKDELGRRIETVSHEVRREAERAGEFARERYGQAKDGLRQGYHRARKDLEQLSGDVETYVRDNPGRSVLIAAGLGFVLGLLLRGDRGGRRA